LAKRQGANAIIFQARHLNK